MGDLVTMSRSASSFRRDPPPGGTAEILFFTGVRYYRMDDALEVPQPRPAAKAKKVVEKRRREQLS